MASPTTGSKRLFSRRNFLRAGLGAAAGLALYSGEVERHLIEVTQRNAFLPGLPRSFEGMRIAQLSDIHMDDYTEPFFLRKVVDRINSLKPDSVFLTGDFVTAEGWSKSSAPEHAQQCAKILSNLQCRPLYAILGNHDIDAGPEEVTAALEANGITLLRNSHVPLERGDGRIWLAGLDDTLGGHPNLELAIPAQIRNVPHEPLMLLCHEPDYATRLLKHPAGQAVDLMISGHTHGGQIRLPLIGPLVLPTMGRKFVEGWFQFGRMRLYVNRGIGTIGVPFRFDCPPEVTLFTLRSTA
jgi:predicted MPP superfamily phosphohydrolase